MRAICLLFLMWQTILLFSSNNYNGVLNINEPYTFEGDSILECQYTPFGRLRLKSTEIENNGIKYKVGIRNDTIKQIICKDSNFSIDGYKIGDTIAEFSNEIISIANPRLDMRYGAYMRIKDDWHAHFDVKKRKITHFVKYFSDTNDSQKYNYIYFDTIPLANNTINSYAIIVNKDFSSLYKKSEIIDLLSDISSDNPEYMQQLYDKLISNEAIIINTYNYKSPYYYLKSPYSFWEYFFLYKIAFILQDAESFTIKPHD